MLLSKAAEDIVELVWILEKRDTALGKTIVVRHRLL